MKSRLLSGAGLVFGSGLCALLYQTTWLRELRLVFGSSTAASAAVLGIFMAGLGAGSALLGRRAECKTRPLAFYARLEFLIAASAAVTPALIWSIRALYVALGGTLAMGDIVGTIVRLVFSTIVLGTPTFLMGGTLPAMARFALDEEDDSRRGVAFLYGLNTLGAVAGAALGTFYFFERFGNHLTLWLACATNALVALLAFWLARNEAYRPLLPKSSREIRAKATAPFRLILVAAAVTGFVFLLMELVWYRMLSPLLGGTTFTFGLILAVALAGMGLGGVAYSLCAGRRVPTLNGFAVTCALEALFLAIPYALGDRLALAAMLLQPLGTLGFYGRVVAWSALAGIVIAPAAFIAGIQFPLLLGLLGKGREEVGSQTGAAYAWNTAGAIAGSLAGGFGFIPLLTAPGTWKVVVLTLVGCAFLAAVIAQRGLSKPLRAVPSLLAGTAAICLLFALGPTAAWRHSQVGIGLVKKYEGSPNQIHDFLNTFRRDLLWEVDGREVSVGVSKTNGLAFVVNGKCDGNVRGDAGTQVMAGLLGALMHPHPTSAAVIGLGTGSTTGWLAAVPSIERVDVMEIEPAITRFAEQCAPVNHDALKNPNVHLLYGDARELLLTSRQKYDVIVSEPSNPYRAGIASLFTREYYQVIAGKLNRGGFFAQWLQAYDVDQRTIQIFYATLSSVFPHIETWRTQDNDLLLIGSQEPVTYDVPGLRERITQEPFKSALANVWRATDLESVFGHYVGNEKLPRVVMRGPDVPLNTDDRTLLEFAFARNLRTDNSYGLDGIRRDAHFSAADHPPGTDALDWAGVELQRIEMFVSSDHPARATDAMSEEQRLLVGALNSYVKDNLSDALQYWKRIGREPRGLIERVMVAEILAEDGDPAALPYIRQVEETNRAEAQAIEARLLWNQEHFEEAAAMAASALEAFRTDPWPLCDLITRTVALAPKIAADDKAGTVAQMLFRALEKPFAVYNMNESRMMALLRIGMDIDHGHEGEYTLRGIQQAEPYIPWQLNFLKLRSACYNSLHHPLAAQAKDDLADYIAAESGAVETKGAPEILPSNRVADGR